MKKLNILIAEDEEILRDLYEVILEGNFDCFITKVENGMDAIETLKASNRFNLILSDYNMPKLNGGGIYAYNRTHDNIPMILLSGGEIEDYADLKGFLSINTRNHFISKPFEDSELINAVTKIFKDTVEKLPEVMQGKDEFIKVRLIHLLKYAQTNIEVYLDLHQDKLTLITNPAHSDELNEQALKHYLDKKIEFVYIKKERFNDFITENSNAIREQLKLKAPPKELIKIASQQFYISISALNSIGISPLQIEMISEIINDSILDIGKDESCFNNLKAICDDQNFLIEHSILIMIIAGAICRETQLDFSTTMKKICLAAFFHDISLSEADLTHKELRIYEIEDERLLNTILSHPVNSAHYLPATKDILDDTKRIILEHHEMPNGDGYPKRLNANQISPLSCLFIISQQIVFCLNRNNYERSRLSDFLKNNEIIFKQGNFSKFYNIAVKKFVTT